MLRRLAVVTLALSVQAGPLLAGGGPETTVVVVHARSPISQEIALEYIALRGIHPSHLVYLDQAPTSGLTDLETFKRTMLRPLRSFLDGAPFGAAIDTVVWSAGFPFGVRFDKAAFGELHQVVTPIASTTGLTFLAPWVLADDPRWLSIEQAQPFFTAELDGARALPEELRTQGFLLSTMLAWTGERGNSVPEVLANLRRTREADFTRPQGSFVFLENQDVRSQTRLGFFEESVLALQELGHDAEVVEGTVPQDATGLLGVMAGKANFDWPGSGSSLAPGAFAEHLTSFGATFQNGSQTKISAWVRAGAAGTAGTVTEPYALWQKFPLPAVHVHYARGCSLAEAVYQSVAMPYQLLVLGDALARPHARAAAIAIDHPPVDAPWDGTVDLGFSLDPQDAVAQVEVWLDGAPLGEVEPGASFTLDTLDHPLGWHRLRVVAVQDDPIATRSSRVYEVRFGEREPVDRAIPLAPAWDEEITWARLRETDQGTLLAPGSWPLHPAPGGDDPVPVGEERQDVPPEPTGILPPRRGRAPLPATCLGPGPVPLQWVDFRDTRARLGKIQVVRVGGHPSRAAEEPDEDEVLLPGLRAVEPGTWSGRLSWDRTGAWWLRADSGASLLFGGDTTGAFDHRLRWEWEPGVHGLVVQGSKTPPALIAEGDEVALQLGHRAWSHAAPGRAALPDFEVGEVLEGAWQANWKKTQRRITGLHLVLATGKDHARDWPTSWVVETSTNGRRWRTVDELRFEASPYSLGERQKGAPQWIGFRFDRVSSAKFIRCRPADQPLDLPPVQRAVASVDRR